MKTSYLTALFVLLLCQLISIDNSQAQIFEWAAATGAGDRDRGQDIAVDSAGNVYTTGFFQGTADFDPGPENEFLTAHHQRDIFVAKYDPDGNLLWAERFGGDGDSEGAGIAIDPEGNVIVSGFFSNLVDFDPGPEDFILQGFSKDIFVLKLTAEGQFIWALKMGDNFNQLAKDVVVDAEGDIYLTGEFASWCDFDPGPEEYIVSAVSAYDGFVVKLDQDGNFEWAQVMRGESLDVPLSCFLDLEGNLLVTGSYRFSIEFGLEDNPITFTASSDEQVYETAFVCKLNATGDFVWAKEFAGNSVSTAVYTDSEGNVLTTGNFTGPVDFDPGEDSFSMASFHPEQSSTFVSKLDPEGDLMWVKIIGGDSYMQSYSIVADSQDNVLWAGGFRAYIDFDPGPDTTLLSAVSLNNLDVFVCKFDTEGNYKWVKSAGGPEHDLVRGMVLDEENNIYTTGSYRATANFETMGGQYNLTSNGFFDYFVSKWSACTDTYSFDNQIACESFTWIDGNTYTQNNNTATVTMQNATCCDSIITLNLTIADINTDIIVTNESLYSTQAEAEYQWLECIDDELVPIENATDQTYYPQESGSFAVAIDYQGCSDTTGCYYLGIIGTEEPIHKNEFAIYPNPTRNKLHVKSDEEFENIKISNLQGQVVIVSNRSEIDVSSLAPGVYMLTANSAGWIWRGRFVKE